MTIAHASAAKRTIKTASGWIAYTEQGEGPVALFVHGVLLNGHLWRHQLAHLSDMRAASPWIYSPMVTRRSGQIRTCP
jgi:pimeloyl-ACP methyl ester carboxylesterase